MFTNHTKYHSDPMNLDNPKLGLGVRIFLYLRPIGPYIALGIIGFILWLVSYMIIFFYKDFLVTHLKRETDRGYYYKYLEYVRIIKPISWFSLIISSFWIVLMILMKEWRWYTISVGCYLFSLTYICYLIKYYFLNKNDFDLFDDYIFLMNKIRNKKELEKLKKE
jgi:hypothetical protein